MPSPILFQQRNLNFINVKDYGAQGDGVSDDTVAIAAAILVGGIIYFPPGTYISSTITLQNHTYLLGAYAGKHYQAQEWHEQPRHY